MKVRIIPLLDYNFGPELASNLVAIQVIVSRGLVGLVKNEKKSNADKVNDNEFEGLIAQAEQIFNDPDSVLGQAVLV